jgi:homogentisate 1,2-dioxygenase
MKLGAPYCERDLRGPSEPVVIDSDEPADVLIKRGDKLAKYTFASHPFDVVGWDGMAYPFAFNCWDYEPIVGRVHQPPPIHETFEGKGYVICTFAPRPLDFHPDAIKVPYAHANVECDEILYYVAGEFGSRKGVGLGSITMHPQGILHGPHPGTIKRSEKAAETNEMAVMMDTWQELRLTAQALELDDPGYPFSWLEDGLKPLKGLEPAGASSNGK